MTTSLTKFTKKAGFVISICGYTGVTTGDIYYTVILAAGCQMGMAMSVWRKKECTDGYCARHTGTALTLTACVIFFIS